MISTPIIYRKHPVKNPGALYSAIQWCGYIFFGIYSVLIILMLMSIGLSSFYNHFSNADAVTKILVEKYMAFGSLITTAMIAIIGFFVATKRPAVKKIKISLPHLPLEFVGTTILQMSDIHVSPTIRKDFIEMLVEISNKIAPDIVVLTGDMVDGSRAQLSDELLPFTDIVAPLGKFMVPGNHEYYWNVNHWLEFWNEIGFKTLVNEHHSIKKEGAEIIMAGVHDYSMGVNSSPQLAVKGAAMSAVKILLAHQPRTVYEASKAGIDLQLSGHTHSGQYFPYNVLIYLFQPYVKGLKRFEKTWIYVNQGTGYWGPPSRFGVPPEITLLELTREADV